MLPEHVAELRVHAALQPVVHARQRSLCRKLGVEEREQDAAPDERVQPVAGRDQARVGPFPPAGLGVERLLGQESAPSGAPVAVRLQPCGGRIRRLDAEQVLGQPVELRAGLQVRPGRGLLLHLAERVEDAPLDLGFGPHPLPRLLEPGPAVSHHDLGRRYRRHERRPGPRVLRPGHVPADHVFFRGRDEDHDVAREVDAVDEHHAVHLAGLRGERPHRPEPRALPPEGAPSALHVALALARHQPRQERCQQLGRVVDLPRERRGAFEASPPLGPRARLPELLGAATAVRALDLRHLAASRLLGTWQLQWHIYRF